MAAPIQLLLLFSSYSYSAPIATTSSGFTLLFGSLLKMVLTIACTFGILVIPATNTTSSSNPIGRLASCNAVLHGPTVSFTWSNSQFYMVQQFLLWDHQQALQTSTSSSNINKLFKLSSCQGVSEMFGYIEWDVWVQFGYIEWDVWVNSCLRWWRVRWWRVSWFQWLMLMIVQPLLFLMHLLIFALLIIVAKIYVCFIFEWGNFGSCSPPKSITVSWFNLKNSFS